ncbi:MAG: bifunctional 2-polyprenyl-6-hydroxyphenol methylase/3-demethylubiquinol 3-O-methyltransferase UbiG [Alphaproteobacteria bacterium GM7ARS4]|nr:bifunctional 2-polyprenyl-6-hydroxyphenol methylase/3-demethylubiquinol 3-O-methyltransferase UbiG [Alphaproteobacteria bacterium GM7ARS4]
MTQQWAEAFHRHDDWWDEHGHFAPLHWLNPPRLLHIKRQVERFLTPDTSRPHALLHGMNVIDIGCGGGLVAEALARLGAHVTAIDIHERPLTVARRHAQAHHLTIDYRCCPVSDMAQSAPAHYDLVINFEVIEHVSDPASYLTDSITLMKKGGIQILSTLNRTWTSFMVAIVGAEYLLRLLERGTHDWNRFLTPQELTHIIHRQRQRHATHVVHQQGLVFDPMARVFRLHPSTDVHYFLTLQKGEKGDDGDGMANGGAHG